MASWGIVSTIKAPVEETLRFAAYHLSKGADHLYLYLDDANEATFVALDQHPQITAIVTDEAWWQKRGRRPEKHQVRQTRNATHAYRRLAQVDWLAHIDVDEFIVSDHDVGETLGGLPQKALCARVRPMEQLSGDATLFKRFIPSGPERHRLVEQLYPTYGQYLKGGFLSHLAGKLFVRTGREDITLRIHNVHAGDEMNPGEADLPNVDLAHAHAQSWDAFQSAFGFRMAKGSYRADLAPERRREHGGITLHELFHQIHAEQGPEGLRSFFEEVCVATPDLTQALLENGLLSRVDLDLNMHLQKHFPGFHQDSF